jgi:hypothetical protein
MWGAYPYLPSGLTLCSDMDNGLYVFRFDDGTPVELTSFAAKSAGSTVTLDWATATEINNLGFEIQRKTSGEFITVGFTEGAGTTTEPQNYSYVDKNLADGNYEYRLKQIDFDGRTEYSDVIEVDVFSVTTLQLKQNYPNPFNPSTKIKYSVPQSGFVNLSVYNLLGEKVTELVNETLTSGEYEADFNATGLPSGIYIAKLSSDNHIQTIKMSLTK